MCPLYPRKQEFMIFVLKKQKRNAYFQESKLLQNHHVDSLWAGFWFILTQVIGHYQDDIELFPLVLLKNNIHKMKWPTTRFFCIFSLTITMRLLSILSMYLGFTRF